LTEKAGIADILAIAIERGAITKSKSGSSVTLTTTPYAWLTAFGMTDTTANWSAHVWERRISASSTFSSEDVTKGDFSSFSDGELKIVVFGNRSARDVVIGTLPGIDAVVDAINNADAQQFTTCSSQLESALGKDRLQNALLHALQGQPLDADFANFTPGPAQIMIFNQCVASMDLQRKADALARANLPKLVEEYLKTQNKLQLSVSGQFHRDATISDYYTLKVLLGDYNPAAGTSTAADTANPTATANLNAQVDFNQRNTTRDGTMKLHDVRSWSIEGAANTALFAQKRLDATLSMKTSRDKDAKAKTIGVAQGKLNVHLNATMTVPVALSYANRDNNVVKKGFQISVGVSALLDQLMSNASAR
jgi:hypothetical protein